MQGSVDSFSLSFNPVPSDAGTVLWIGDRRHESFRKAYEFCEAVSSQVAFRSSLDAAIARPAAVVRLIIWSCKSDSTVEHSRFRRLRSAYPDAEVVLLLGPLCFGQRPSPAERLRVTGVAWSDWEAFLPNRLRDCGFREPPDAPRGTVLIVTRRRENGDALAALLSSTRRPSVCSAPEAIGRVAMIEEVWWDDSATGREPDWPLLLQRYRAPKVRHCWVTSFLTPALRRKAANNGIATVVRKPGDLSALTRATSIESGVSRREAA
ncbi:MAG: hypothetical protein AAFX06_29230 [Planctomycetota bacterium]